MHVQLRSKCICFGRQEGLCAAELKEAAESSVAEAVLPLVNHTAHLALAFSSCFLLSITQTKKLVGQRIPGPLFLVNLERPFRPVLYLLGAG